MQLLKEQKKHRKKGDTRKSEGKEEEGWKRIKVSKERREREKKGEKRRGKSSLHGKKKMKRKGNEEKENR